MAPAWLTALSVISLIAAGICTAVIAIDEFRRPQHMWIINLVWPITALYAGPLALWFYFAYGRAPMPVQVPMAMPMQMAMPMSHDHDHGHQQTPGPKHTKPRWASYAIATTHCGSGCVIGDILSEWTIYFFPAVLTWFGFKSLWDQPMFAAWVLDFILAFLFGIAFQYFTIAPMKHLSFGPGLVAALKADSLSLTAWQIGMYGWMAVAMFLLFRHDLPKISPVFWFMMQLAMLVGFVTSYPVNIWLVRRGIKEEM